MVQAGQPEKLKPGQMNSLQLAGDAMAVAKQQINNERIRNEVKHLVKNRTDDFVQNPMKRKLPKHLWSQAILLAFLLI